MSHPSHFPSNSSATQGPSNVPYSGPERRIADRGRPVETSGGNGGYHALGPYLPDRRRARQGTPARAMPVIAAPWFEANATAEPIAIPTGILAEIEVEELGVSAVATEDESSSALQLSAIFGEIPEPSTPPVTGAVELPWITTFLDDVPDESSTVTAEWPVEAVEESEAVATTRLLDDSADVSPGTVAGDAFVDTLDALDAGPVVEEGARPTTELRAELLEEWPLDEAGAQMRELADAIESNVSHVASVDRSSEFATPSAVLQTPLPMWGDDDLGEALLPYMSTLTPMSSAAVPAPAAERSASSEAAAVALESLARRVRSGELALAGFDPSLGDAAALATTLAALLGAHG